MRVCPKCGERDGIYWRGSRYDFNAEYCRREEFAEMEPELDECLAEDHPLVDGSTVYYRRGSNKTWVYRVQLEDFHVDAERAYTKPRNAVEKGQLKLLDVKP